MNKREQFKVGQPKIKLTYRYTYRYIYIYTHPDRQKKSYKLERDRRLHTRFRVTIDYASNMSKVTRAWSNILPRRIYVSRQLSYNGIAKMIGPRSNNKWIWESLGGLAEELRRSERPRARPYFLELSTNASNGIGRLIHRVYENVSRRPTRVSTKLSPRNDHFSLLFIDSKKRRFFVCRRTIPRTDFPRLARACARARNILRK